MPSTRTRRFMKIMVLLGDGMGDYPPRNTTDAPRCSRRTSPISAGWPPPGRSARADHSRRHVARRRRGQFKHAGIRSAPLPIRAGPTIEAAGAAWNWRRRTSLSAATWSTSRTASSPTAPPAITHARGRGNLHGGYFSRRWARRKCVSIPAPASATCCSGATGP